MKTGYYEYCLNHGLIYIGLTHNALECLDFIAGSADNFLLYAETLECDQVVAYYADSSNTNDCAAINKLNSKEA